MTAVVFVRRVGRGAVTAEHKLKAASAEKGF